MSDNLNFWNSVCKTNPKNTKEANVRGNKITAISPQTQIMNATEKFGMYGLGWGFKEINFDYSITNLTGIVVFNAIFFYIINETEKSFPISSSISAYRDKAQKMPDADFAKKVETDTLTKALSKIGFNADVFMGLYDDHKYVQMMKDEFKVITPENKKLIAEIVNNVATNNSNWIRDNWGGCISKLWNELDSDVTEKLNIIAKEN